MTRYGIVIATLVLVVGVSCGPIDIEEPATVNLDEVVKDLEEQGFAIKRIEKDGETHILKVDLGSVETAIREIEPKSEPSIDEKTEDDGKLDRSEILAKIRRKRTLKKKYGGGGGGGCSSCYQPQPQTCNVCGGSGHQGGHGGSYAQSSASAGSYGK